MNYKECRIQQERILFTFKDTVEKLAILTDGKEKGGVQMLLGSGFAVMDKVEEQKSTTTDLAVSLLTEAIAAEKIKSNKDLLIVALTFVQKRYKSK